MQRIFTKIIDYDQLNITIHPFYDEISSASFLLMENLTNSHLSITVRPMF